MASSFSAERTLDVAGKKYKYFSMAELPAKQLPYSLKILLENMLRTEDGANVTAEHVNAIVNWIPRPNQTLKSSSPLPG